MKLNNYSYLAGRIEMNNMLQWNLDLTNLYLTKSSI